MSKYEIVSTLPEIYLDLLGKAINGYKVTFIITALNEPHIVYVPRLDALMIKSTVEAVITERDKLSALGK
jgi:hypothetical protein